MAESMQYTDKDSSRRLLLRKYSSVDLQQCVLRLDVYSRSLASSSGGSGTLFGLDHEGAVATTESGMLYLIEKTVSDDDDSDYHVQYREGACSVVQVTKKDIRQWQLVKSVNQVRPDLTLEDLLDACGCEYDVLTDNCWNGTQRMRACANDAEDELSWQAKTAIGAAIVGTGALLFGASFSSSNKRKEGRKY